VRIALVSDTHGLTDPKLPELFQGCERVLHAGDIVTTPVLDVLAKIAPVTAVRGNNDVAPQFERLPETVCLPVGELRLLMVHDLGDRARPKPPAGKALARDRPHIVIHGHSHKPGAVVHAGRLFVNPGSAGPRRFTLPRTAAIMTVTGRRAQVEFFELSGPRPTPHGATFEADL
jgi:putative phosphoesterase